MGSYSPYGSAYQNEWLARPPLSPRSDAYTSSPRFERTSSNNHALVKRRSRSPVGQRHGTLIPSPIWSQPASLRVGRDENGGWPVSIYTYRAENNHQGKLCHFQTSITSLADNEKLIQRTATSALLPIVPSPSISLVLLPVSIGTVTVAATSPTKVAGTLTMILEFTQPHPSELDQEVYINVACALYVQR